MHLEFWLCTTTPQGADRHTKGSSDQGETKEADTGKTTQHTLRLKSPGCAPLLRLRVPPPWLSRPPGPPCAAAPAAAAARTCPAWQQEFRTWKGTTRSGVQMVASRSALCCRSSRSCRSNFACTMFWMQLLISTGDPSWKWLCKPRHRILYRQLHVWGIAVWWCHLLLMALQCAQDEQSPNCRPADQAKASYSASLQRNVPANWQSRRLLSRRGRHARPPCRAAAPPSALGSS